MDVTKRFLDYVSYSTASDEYSESVPSAEGQRVLGAALAEELRRIGITAVEQDECGYVYAYLPASPGCEALPDIGFIAHMDTSPAVSGENICPAVVEYHGGDLVLKSGVVISPREFPSLDLCKGQQLIVTDGTTLLGADDKAGIAEIVTACEELLCHPEMPHRGVAVCFTPDEEIGRGTDHFDFSKFHAKAAYTVDGGELGEIEYENFNGAAATVTIHGINIHPGSAKGRMKNACLIAGHLITEMPAAETPACTEGYEGFYHLCDMQGNESEATLHYIIRDHDREKFEARKAFLTDLVGRLNRTYGAGTLTLELRDSYYNMKEKILPHMELIRNAEAAMRTAGVTPVIVPIRGGTDGARLSHDGLPCPNLSTGGINFHSIREFIPIPAMEGMVQVLLHLAGPDNEM